MPGRWPNAAAIIEAAYGPGKTGACFAVVDERWQQIIFGFYPRDLYWRPTLTLVLMLVALAPVLFSGVPREMLWFSLRPSPPSRSGCSGAGRSGCR